MVQPTLQRPSNEERIQMGLAPVPDVMEEYQARRKGRIWYPEDRDNPFGVPLFVMSKETRAYLYTEKELVNGEWPMLTAKLESRGPHMVKGWPIRKNGKATSWMLPQDFEGKRRRRWWNRTRRKKEEEDA